MNSRMRSLEAAGREKDSRSGFTLIELLTVIAIIAILAAMIFPVISHVRVQAQQTQVRANLQTIHTSLTPFQQSERRYPTALGEVRIPGPNGIFSPSDVLFPEWLKDRSALQSPNKDVPNPDDFIKVSVPKSVARGYISPDVPPGAVDRVRDGYLSASDNMDGSAEGTDYLLHYSRYRTLKKQDCDYQRQLGFRNPPETTVVTWNDSWVDRDDRTGVPYRGDYLVLFLNGKVKKFGFKQVDQQIQAKIDRGCPEVEDFPAKEQIWRLEP